MPSYHLPAVRSILLRSYDRLKAFLFKASKVLIPVIMALSILNSLGTDGTFGNENTDKSVLAAASKVITPVLEPLGVTEENWPATVGVFTGIFAKEAVVGTLDALYAGIDQQEQSEVAAEEEGFDFWAGISGAFATIPENLLGVLDTLTDPLGLSIGDVSDATSAAEAQEVSEATFGSMVRLFGGQSAAFAYLLFVLLYFPCSAAIAAVFRETNLAWTAFIGFWTTFMAYLAATLFYQVAKFSAHPGYSLTVIAADLAAFSAVILTLNLVSRSRQRQVLCALPVSVQPLAWQANGKKTMDLIQLKGYLRARKIVPLQDMALHFQTDIETIRPLLAVWIGKGKVRQRPGSAASCKDCCQCDPAAIEVYEWVG